MMGFDGKLKIHNPYDGADVHNSYPEGKSPYIKGWFKEWFPYQESSDKSKSSDRRVWPGNRIRR